MTSTRSPRHSAHAADAPGPAVPAGPRKVVFKLTFPNGKIYVGKDLTDTLTALGEVDAARVAADMTPRQRHDFVVRKEVVWESTTASDEEVAAVAAAYIRALGAADPAMGYNPPAPHAPPG